AGAGVTPGASYGRSDRQAAYPLADSVTPGDLAATLFHALGIPPATPYENLTTPPSRIVPGTPATKLVSEGRLRGLRKRRPPHRNSIALARQNGYKSLASPLMVAGSGGGKAERVQGWIESEFSGLDYDGEVRIVRYKPRAAKTAV